MMVMICVYGRSDDLSILEGEGEKRNPYGGGKILVLSADENPFVDEYYCCGIL